MTAAKPWTLIVEDDQAGFAWARRQLHRYGFSVVWTRTAADAIATLSARTPQCLVVSLLLPDDGAAEVITFTKANGLATKVAVVADPSRVADAIALRPNRCLQRPIDGIELVAWLTANLP